MKYTFTLLFIAFGFCTYAQSARSHNTYDSSYTVGIPNGIQGIFEGAGNATYLAGNKFGNKTYYSFVKVSGYANFSTSDYKIAADSFFPTSLLKIGQYIYVTAEYTIGSHRYYGILKLSADNGNPILFLNIDSAPALNHKVKLVQIPNTQEMMLSYHTLTNDSISEIRFISLNESLSATGFTKMLSFPTLKSQGYITTNDSYDFLLNGSILYYSLLFKNGNDCRFETGDIDMGTGNVLGRYSVFQSTTAPVRTSQLIQVRNDSTFYLIDNSLVIHRENDTVSIHHKLNLFITEGNCVNLKQMPNSEWMALFYTPNSATGGSPIGIINGANMKVYFPFASASSILLNGNNVLILGTYNGNATALDDFNMNNFSACHQFQTTDNVLSDQKTIASSQAAISSTHTFTPISLALPTWSDFPFINEPFCNPNKYGISETDANALIRLYPNPAVDFLYLEIENENILQLSVIDIAGKTIFTENHSAPSIRLEINQIPAGMYIVKARTAYKTFTRRFIKQ